VWHDAFMTAVYLFCAGNTDETENLICFSILMQIKYTIFHQNQISELEAAEFSSARST
jgi:hypothetical protein